MEPVPERDPRLYMAAERTFLAWLRTGLALMGFGFVVSRFALFLRELAAAPAHAGPTQVSSTLGLSLPLGIALIALGVITNVVASARHARYIRALDAGNFRPAFGSQFAYLVGGVLALLGLVMAAYLARV